MNGWQGQQFVTPDLRPLVVRVRERAAELRVRLVAEQKELEQLEKMLAAIEPTTPAEPTP